MFCHMSSRSQRQAAHVAPLSALRRSSPPSVRLRSSEVVSRNLGSALRLKRILRACASPLRRFASDLRGSRGSRGSRQRRGLQNEAHEGQEDQQHIQASLQKFPHNSTSNIRKKLWLQATPMVRTRGTSEPRHLHFSLGTHHSSRPR